MIAPEAIRAQLARRWASGQVLRDWLLDVNVFPIRIPVGVSAASRLLHEFSAVRGAIERLETGSRKPDGRGYRIEYTERRLRQLGAQQLPAAICIDRLEDLLRIIGRDKDFAAFTALTRETLARHPNLRAWLVRRPLAAFEARQIWPRMLTVCEWFINHPKPRLYLRQLDIPGVDTKFVEHHQTILIELLDELLPADAIDTNPPPSPKQRFAHRYGLRYEQPLVRLRLLDDQLRAYYRKLSDLTLTNGEFRALDPPCTTVFVTENKTNGLSFPDFADALVVFGLGYGLELLYDSPWLKNKRLIYWGDLDTHGFAMLAKLRTHYPQTQSLLMDETTLRNHADLTVEEPAASRIAVTEEWLTSNERAVLHALLANRYGHRLRLEQERVPFGAVLAALTPLRDV